MRGKNNGKCEIARKYRDKHGMGMAQRKLAKIMYDENESLFKNIEDARYWVRYVEGKTGDKHRDGVKQTKYFMEETRTLSPYKLPEPDTQDLKPYVLPLSWDDFIFASDFHVPNHRTEPIKAMLDYAIENNIKKLLLGGDLLDNTPFTRWLHEPIAITDVPRWFDMARDLLIQFKTVFDEIIWIEGNHDFWFKRWLMEKAEILFGDPYFHLESRLRLNELGIKYIDQRHLIKAGKLNIHHGHITLRGGGSYANAARMVYMKTKSSMMVGHVHVESSHTEPDIDDKIQTTFSVGCMCTLRPDYQPFGGKACHGFARVRVKQNKDFNVNNFRIYKGQII